MGAIWGVRIDVIHRTCLDVFMEVCSGCPQERRGFAFLVIVSDLGVCFGLGPEQPLESKMKLIPDVQFDGSGGNIVPIHTENGRSTSRFRPSIRGDKSAINLCQST